MPIILTPNKEPSEAFLSAISKTKIEGNLSVYINSARTIFDKSVRPEYPFLDLIFPTDGSLAYIIGFAVIKSTVQLVGLRADDEDIASFGMPMVGVLTEDFIKRGVSIVDAYGCINRDELISKHDSACHVNPPNKEWGNVCIVCTHKHSIGIDKNTCMLRPTRCANEIYLEYMHMDRTGDDFRIKSWPHGE